MSLRVVGVFDLGLGVLAFGGRQPSLARLGALVGGWEPPEDAGHCSRTSLHRVNQLGDAQTSVLRGAQTKFTLGRRPRPASGTRGALALRRVGGGPDPRLVADDPCVVPGRDLVDRVGADFYGRPVGHLDVHPPCEDESEMVELAPLGRRHRLDVEGPSPAGFEDLPPDGRLAGVDELDPPVVDDVD